MTRKRVVDDLGKQVKLLRPQPGDVIVVTGLGDDTDRDLFDMMMDHLRPFLNDALMLFVGPGQRIDLLREADMAEHGWVFIGQEKARAVVVGKGDSAWQG